MDSNEANCESNADLMVSDVFDDLKTENQRLTNELIFAEKCLNRLKTVLVIWHDKYGHVIDDNDKQEFNEISNILAAIQLSRQTAYDFFGIGTDVRPKKSRKVTEILPKKRLTKSLDNAIRQMTLDEMIVQELSGAKPMNNTSDDWAIGDQLDEDIETLRQQYIRRQNIFDPNTNSFKCPKSDCNKSFKVTESLYQHLRVVHKMPKIKDKNYGYMASIDCYDQMTNTYRCPKANCNKEFGTKSRLYRHLTIVHSNKPKIVCTEANCGKLLKNGTNLRIHMKTAHSAVEAPKPFVCEHPSCDYRCRTKHELIQHLSSHSDVRPFKCEVAGCDKSFKNARGLREHAFCHFSEPSLECQFEGCHQLFQTVWHRKNHMNVVHLGRSSSDRPIKQCDWPGCEYTTRFAHQIKKHKRLHTGEKPYACDWTACGKRFRLKQQLIDHMNIHNNVKPYVCHWPGCHYRCSDSANLRKHVRTSHNTSKQNTILQMGIDCI